MKILVLDDQEIIRRAAEDYYVDPHDYRKDEFTQTTDVKEFVELVFSGEWDEIWIDHDLGQGNITGRTATKDIYDQIGGLGRKLNGNPTFLIITMNPSAVNSMLSDLVMVGLPAIWRSISFLEPLGISRGDYLTKK